MPCALWVRRHCGTLVHIVANSVNYLDLYASKQALKIGRYFVIDNMMDLAFFSTRFSSLLAWYVRLAPWQSRVAARFPEQ